MTTKEKQDNPLKPDKIQTDTFKEMLKKYDFKTYLELYPEVRIKLELDPMSRIGKGIEIKIDR